MPNQPSERRDEEAEWKEMGWTLRFTTDNPVHGDGVLAQGS